MKIERPDLYSRIFTDKNSLNIGEFNKWFDEHIEPINKMLEESVEVFGYYDKYNTNETLFGSGVDEVQTHKALLINIEPIGKETAEDVLRDFVNSYEGDGTITTLKRVDELVSRALTVLGED